MNQVNYLIFRFRRAALAVLAAAAVAAGCAGTGEARIVSPFTGPESGPRSYPVLAEQIARQSESLRDLYLQAQGLYPYLANSYRVSLTIERDGEIDEVRLLDRTYVLPDFEEAFLERVARFRFEECRKCSTIQVIYTFEFSPDHKNRLKPPPPMAEEETAPEPAEEAGKTKIDPTTGAEAAGQGDIEQSIEATIGTHEEQTGETYAGEDEAAVEESTAETSGAAPLPEEEPAPEEQTIEEERAGDFPVEDKEVQEIETDGSEIEFEADEENTAGEAGEEMGEEAAEELEGGALEKETVDEEAAP